MNVLIINLTRFGDLIQTQPVISGFKQQGHAVGLVCLSNFASAATLLDGVDRVFSFSGAELLAGLDENWRQAVRNIADFKSTIFDDFLPDKVVNLTPSVSSRLLAYGVQPSTGATAGFTVDDHGFNADTSSWAAFLQMAGTNRGASPFNVCDLFRRAAGLHDEGNTLELARPDQATLVNADTLLSEVDGDAFGAFQMGASEERRRWPVAHFVETARLLYERDGVVPVLLGTKGEAGLGERFAEVASFPFVNCIGRTSLTELAGVLSQCSLLVTNDTGTMHLAAGLGVPICSIFLATAQPWDTGPYRAGNICLEPDLECHPCEFGKPCPHGEECRHSVSAQAMYGYAASLLGKPTSVGIEGARAWQTRTGEDGFMELVSLSGHDATDRAVWISLQRTYFRAFLDGAELPTGTGLGKGLQPSVRAEVSKTLTNAHDMVFLLLQQGLLLAKNPRPQAKNKFLASWQRLQTILSSSQHLNIIALLWVFESQRHGEDLPSLLALADRYRALFAALRDELS